MREAGWRERHRRAPDGGPASRFLCKSRAHKRTSELGRGRRAKATPNQRPAIDPPPFRSTTPPPIVPHLLAGLGARTARTPSGESLAASPCCRLLSGGEAIERRRRCRVNLRVRLAPPPSTVPRELAVTSTAARKAAAGALADGSASRPSPLARSSAARPCAFVNACPPPFFSLPHLPVPLESRAAVAASAQR